MKITVSASLINFFVKSSSEFALEVAEHLPAINKVLEGMPLKPIKIDNIPFFDNLPETGSIKGCSFVKQDEEMVIEVDDEMIKDLSKPVFNLYKNSIKLLAPVLGVVKTYTVEVKSAQEKWID